MIARDVAAEPPLAAVAAVREARRAEGIGGFCRRSPLAVVGGVILLVVVLASVLAPVLTAVDPVKPSFGRRLAPPWALGGSSTFVLGADNLGRDIFARVLYGGRISLALATSAVILAASVGVVVGLAAGCLGGRVDDLVMRVADVQLAFPVIMLAIAIMAVLGTSPAALVGVLALSGWVLYARTVRASVLIIRQLEYVEAARTLGASDLRVIARHILPNTLAPILVIGSSQFATMVLLESGLSFLGMGIQPPQPSWGVMLAEGRDYLSNAWWLATAPGVAISLVVLGANLLGDGLRDLLDPHARHV
jgi:peptide/nickel transport system permease protein